MRDFFQGWRRKAGAVTLVIACIFMAGWIRGLSTFDAIFLGTSDSLVTHDLSFSDHGIQWTRTECLTEKRFRRKTEWISVPIGSLNIGKSEREWHWKFRGFGIAIGDSVFRSAIRTSIRNIPYWAFITPLMLLSAWLLLNKPKPKLSTAEQDLVMNSGD
jgi:hypothetical protein